MYNKVKRIITCVLVIGLVIGALLYFVPWPTRVNLTLDATKLDKDGNVIGITTITIKGVMLDFLFQKDSLNVSIYPFDNFRWIQLTNNANTNREGIIYAHCRDCVKILCSACDTEPRFCELLFTKDFKYVAFVSDTYEDDAKTYYVASANGEITTDELIEYFRYLPPFG